MTKTQLQQTNRKIKRITNEISKSIRLIDELLEVDINHINDIRSSIHELLTIEYRMMLDLKSYYEEEFNKTNQPNDQKH